MRNLIRFVIRTLLKLLTRVQILGREHVPATGSYVIASNHLGVIDSVIVFYALDNWDVFIPVAEKWEKVAFYRWLGKYLNFIFIDRFNPDLKAMRAIINRMKQGQVLVIAPEGTRSRSGGLIEGKPGASYLAAKAGYPILPIALTGTEDSNVFGGLKRFKRAQITITAGPPFNLPALPVKGRDEALKRYTDEIMCRIAMLLPEHYRGVYAKHPRLKELLRSGGK